jgi:type II secretory pathway component PulC
VRALVLLTVFGASACGGSAPQPPSTPRPAASPVAKPAASAAPRTASTTIRRTDLTSVVDAGFGYFLERVQVEPSLDSGRFRGWTIVELTPPAFWETVDLKPGDVVTSVNGLPIEREMDAWNAFESLKTAKELDVAYFRGGAERKLAYRIVD